MPTAQVLVKVDIETDDESPSLALCESLVGKAIEDGADIQVVGVTIGCNNFSLWTDTDDLIEECSHRFKISEGRVRLRASKVMKKSKCSLEAALQEMLRK